MWCWQVPLLSASDLVELSPPNLDLPRRPSGPKFGDVPAGWAPGRMGQPPVLPQLVRVPVQGPPGRGQVAQNCKGGPPFAHDRRALPHVIGHMGPPHF